MLTPRAETRGGRRRERTRLALLLALALGLGACSTPEPQSVDEATPPIAGEPEPAPVPGPTAEPEPEPELTPDPEPEPEPEPEPPPPPPASRAALVGALEDLLDDGLDALDEVTLTVLVVDEYGRELLAHGADTAVLPASTLKIITAAAALETFGPDARLVTRVTATTGIDPDGVLDGHLTIIGAGDPSLGTPEYGRWIHPARPRTPLETLADDLVDAGLRRVTGHVRAVAPGYDGPSAAEGWIPRYFSDFDTRYASGLTVDAGLATSIRWPQLEQQRAEELEAEAEGEADEATEPREPISIPLLGGRDDIEQSLAGLDPPLARVEVVADPRRQAARELIRLLEERGVEIDGEIRLAVAAGPGEVLAEVTSRPLEELLRFAVQRSDNQLTDGLFLLVGRERTNLGTWTRAEQAVREVLDDLGVGRAGLRMADGSGLSRDDRLTPRVLVELDRAMWSGPHVETWASLQAVAGESGTLRQRLRGTPAAGRLLGKTGTLNDVTALSGAVVGDEGGRYHFAVLANEAAGAARWPVRALMDELVVRLAADVQGCAIRTPAPAPPEDDDEHGGDEHESDETEQEPVAQGPLGRQPVTVVCP